VTGAWPAGRKNAEGNFFKYKPKTEIYLLQSLRFFQLMEMC